MNGDYLIIAPKKDGGYSHQFSERTFLVENILNFLDNHPDVTPNQITVYELNEVNLRKSERGESEKQ